MGQYDTPAQTPKAGGPSPNPGHQGNGTGQRDLGNDARRFADEARQGARQAVDSHRETGAAAVDSVAKAVRTAADQLDKDSPEIARYTREAATMAENVSEAIRTRSIGDVIRGADDFARREPVAFFGAALVAGFAVARFLSSSSRHSHDRHGDEVASGMASGAGDRTYRSGYGSGYAGREDMDDRYRRSGMGNAGSGSSAASDFGSNATPRSAASTSGSSPGPGSTASSFGETAKTGAIGSSSGIGAGSRDHGMPAASGIGQPGGSASTMRRHETQPAGTSSGTLRPTADEPDYAAGAGSRAGGPLSDAPEPPERPDVRKGPDPDPASGRSTISGSGATPTSLSKGASTGDGAPSLENGRSSDPDR